MKVYVVKNPQGKYLTEMMDFTNELIFANLFVDVESAWGYAPNDCEVVECELIEKKELADHDKKVRAEVVEEIRDLAGDYWEETRKYNHETKQHEDVLLMCHYDLEEILDRVLGGEEWKD